MVNNAGYSVYGSVEDVTAEDARRQFEVNFFGVTFLTKAVLPFMREQKSGSIINVTSIAGKIGWALGSYYHASKHALEGWSDSLRMEVKQFGIDVVIIEPGAIKSEFYEVMNQPLIDRSKDGPYETLASRIIDLNEKNDDGAASLSPDVIGRLIFKAVNDINPKTRYVGGKGARLALFLRKILSDKLFDKALLSQLK